MAGERQVARPFWWPDFRGGVAGGFFLLTWRILEIVSANPELLKNVAFMQVAGQVMGAGGLLLICAYLFGSSKGSADNAQRADTANEHVGRLLDVVTTKEGPK